MPNKQPAKQKQSTPTQSKQPKPSKQPKHNPSKPSVSGQPASQPAGVKTKHIPQRTCIVCRETSAKRTLTRVVRVSAGGLDGAEGEAGEAVMTVTATAISTTSTVTGVYVDPTGKRNGRGAYLCDKRSCWKRAVESDVLEKALRTSLTDADRTRLREVMSTMSTDQTQDQQG